MILIILDPFSCKGEFLGKGLDSCATSLNMRYMNLDSHRLGEIVKLTKNVVQANLLLKTPPQSPKRREDFSSGEILNGQGNMEYHAGTRQVNIEEYPFVKIRK